MPGGVERSAAAKRKKEAKGAAASGEEVKSVSEHGERDLQINEDTQSPFPWSDGVGVG